MSGESGRLLLQRISLRLLVAWRGDIGLTPVLTAELDTEEKTAAEADSSAPALQQQASSLTASTLSAHAHDLACSIGRGPLQKVGAFHSTYNPIHNLRLLPAISSTSTALGSYGRA